MCSPPEPGDQLARRAQGDDLALVDDGDAVAEPLGLVHVVGGEKDGSAAVLQVPDDLPELAAGLGVEARGGLVEEEELGISDQRDGDGEPLLLAAGKLLDQGVGLALQRDPGDRLVDGQARPVEAAKDDEQLAHRLLVGEPRLLEGHADSLADRRRLGRPPQAEHLDLSRGRLVEPFEDLDGRGLARSVGAEEAKALAHRDLQVDAVDRMNWAISARVLLAQFLDANGPITHGRHVSSWARIRL